MNKPEPMLHGHWSLQDMLSTLPQPRASESLDTWILNTIGNQLDREKQASFAVKTPESIAQAAFEYAVKHSGLSAEDLKVVKDRLISNVSEATTVDRNSIDVSINQC